MYQYFFEILSCISGWSLKMRLINCKFYSSTGQKLYSKPCLRQCKMLANEVQNILNGYLNYGNWKWWKNVTSIKKSRKTCLEWKIKLHETETEIRFLRSCSPRGFFVSFWLAIITCLVLILVSISPRFPKKWLNTTQRLWRS